MSTEKTTEELAKRAKDLYATKEYEAAAKAFFEAAEAYQSAGDALAAAEMRNNAAVAWLQAGKPQNAYEAAQGTPEIFAEAGDVRREGLAWGNIGSALDGLKRWQEAAEAYKKAADLLEQVGAKEERVAVLQALSAVELRLNNPAGALITMQEAVENQPSSLKKSVLKRLLKAPFKLLGG